MPIALQPLSLPVSLTLRVPSEAPLRRIAAGMAEMLARHLGYAKGDAAGLGDAVEREAQIIAGGAASMEIRFGAEHDRLEIRAQCGGRSFVLVRELP
jgi:hypothetical protein